MTRLSGLRPVRHAKIVYYGPGMAGKSSNLQSLARHWPGAGPIRSEAAETYRQMSLDLFKPASGKTPPILFHLATTPGCVLYEWTRTKVLEGADGVVFVADSQRDKLQENIKSLQELARMLTRYGQKVSQMPIVLQFNKRDLIGSVSVDVLAKYLNPIGWPVIEASAAHNRGVLETFEAITARVAATIR